MTDPVRTFLLDKGCGDHVVNGGLGGLVETWEQVVASVDRGYDFGLDDWLNDLDARQLLAEAWAVAPPEEQQMFLERLQAADEQMQALLDPAPECLWGEEVAEEEGWTRGANWWYYGVPRNAGETLQAELSAE